MTNTPIIHVGFPKAGSTWLQYNLFPLIENINYIHHKVVKKDFILGGLEFNIEHIRQKYSNSESLLLSHELLIGGPINLGSFNGLLTKEFCNRLKNIFPDSRIILFLRSQPDIISSSYYQYIKGGGTFGVKKYLFQNNFRALNVSMFFSLRYLEYDKIIDLYKNEFGENNIHIFLFEDFKSNPKEFIKDFCEIFNFKIDVNKIDFGIQNQRYRPAIKNLARFANLFYRKSVAHKTNIVNIPTLYPISQKILFRLNRYKIFGSYSDSKKVLRKNYDKIYKHYKDSNKRLITNHKLNNINKYNYPL